MKKRVKHTGIMIPFVYFWGAAQTKQYYLSLRSLPLVVENRTVLFETRNHPSLLCDVMLGKGDIWKFLISTPWRVFTKDGKEVKICSKDKNGAFLLIENCEFVK